MKDSVVGEERIAQYLLAVLNTRGTPLHWRHVANREMEGFHREYDDKPEYNLKDLLPKRRKLPNKSDVHYVEVISYSFVSKLKVECNFIILFLINPVRLRKTIS